MWQQVSNIARLSGTFSISREVRHRGKIVRYSFLRRMWKWHNNNYDTPYPPKFCQLGMEPRSGHDQKIRKLTECEQNLISSEGSQHTSACQISDHSSHALSRKYLETPNLTCFAGSKCLRMSKINRPWPKSNHPWRWWGYISMSSFRPPFPCVLLKIPGNR